MNNRKRFLIRFLIVCAVTTVPLLLTLFTLQTAVTAAPRAYPLGYGFNVAEWDTSKLQEMGFNWMKVFNAPGSPQPVNVLLRVDVNASTLNDLDGFRSSMSNLAQNNGEYIDAYEIGNEVNLDASYGWATAPLAADYVQILCAAYQEIKAHDPTAVIVSAGLAPTGRVSGNWEGHAGHNGLYQDEREYFKEMITAGANSCLDAVGYHNYGYSADYDTAPDTHGGTSETNCTNGFCFRGAEKIYEIMVAEGMGDKQIWTTEFGWITDPAEEGLGACKDNDPGWAGRAWQIVTQEKQAYNLAGAYQYAADNWPWMGAMFAFNLNFNQAGYYDQCEQMRFYSVEGRPAETALREIPKVTVQPTPQLVVSGPKSIAMMAITPSLPVSTSALFTLSNSGTAPLTYTITADSTAAVVSTFSGPVSGTIAPDETITVTAYISSGTRPTGTYTGTITIAIQHEQAEFPQEIPLAIYIVEQIYAVNLPLIIRP